MLTAQVYTALSWQGMKHLRLWVVDRYLYFFFANSSALTLHQSKADIDGSVGGGGQPMAIFVFFYIE